MQTMQRGISMAEMSVRMSVGQTHEFSQNERNLCPHFIPYERPIILVSSKKNGW